MVNERSARRLAWHYLTADEAEARLVASFDDGLTEDEVISRRAVHGENRMTPKAGTKPWRRFALQFI